MLVHKIPGQLQHHIKSLLTAVQRIWRLFGTTCTAVIIHYHPVSGAKQIRRRVKAKCAYPQLQSEHVGARTTVMRNYARTAQCQRRNTLLRTLNNSHDAAMPIALHNNRYTLYFTATTDAQLAK